MSKHRYVTHVDQPGGRCRVIGWNVRCDVCGTDSAISRRKADALRLAKLMDYAVSKKRDVCGNCRAKEAT